MGMYTELVLSCRIKNDPVAVEVLKFMCGKMGSDDALPLNLPEHPLFATTRWCRMFHSASYYFVPHSVAVFKQDAEIHTAREWSLIVRCDLKNYDNEIEKVIDWLQPYLAAMSGEMIGYHRYEESDHPTIIYTSERDD